MKYIIYLLIVLPSIVMGQNAIFYADTNRSWNYIKENKRLLKEVKEMRWKINGQVLSFGSKPIKVKPNPNKIDTIFFKQNNRAEWDTLICIIKQPLTYRFLYNTCCGGFDVADDSGRILGEINFKIKGKDDKKTYLGTLGEAGIIVNELSTDTLREGCRSAMSPNIYHLTFSAIEICKDTVNCSEGTCLYEKGEENLKYDFGYRAISKKLNVLYMPLSRDPIQIIYDTNTDKIKFE